MRGYTVEWAEPGNFVLTRRDQLFQSSSLSPPFTFLGHFPSEMWKHFGARFRPFQRALRFLFYNVIPLKGKELFLTFGKDIGIYRDGTIRRLDKLKRPCRILRSACAQDQKGNVYFGEYINNEQRDIVRVYRYVIDEDQLEVVYRFRSGEVRHVHGIYFDPFDKCLWCLTGDLPTECRILRTCDGFQTLEVVGEGDETWRAVSVLFTKDAIYYGMDAEFQTNHVYRCDRRTGKRTDLGEVDGPIYYSFAAGAELFFSVTAELCPSQVGRSATLWHVEKDDHLTRVVSIEKDFLHRGYFMRGTMHFPQGPGLADELLFHALGLKGADNRTFRVGKCSF